jgi:hypothetical protein
MMKTGISENICSEGIRQRRGEYKDYYYRYNRFTYLIQPSLCFGG